MDARSFAARAVAEVLDGAALAPLRHHPLAQSLSELDRSFAQELTYGTLRWWPRLDFFLRQLLQRKGLRRQDHDVRALLAVGLYQLTELQTPEHAAVAATVASARHLRKPWASGLLNAVLRNFLRRREELQQASRADEPALHGHPQWLLQSFRDDWPETWQAIVAGNNVRPPLALRINRGQTSRAAYQALLAAQDLAGEEIPTTPAGLVLRQPVGVDRLPGFAQGLVSVQDGAAQLAAAFLDLQPGQRVLDACAAPGGKTAQILESEPRLREVVAIDSDPERLGLVRTNLARLHLSARLIVGDAGEPADWHAGESFDRILLDAPCSATGVIRRHPDIKLLRLATDIPALQARQRRLLQALWPLLAKGGKLVYATCSILKAENQQQIEDFLASHPEAKLQAPPELCQAFTNGIGTQIFPGQAGMDGFYYAALSKLE